MRRASSLKHMAVDFFHRLILFIAVIAIIIATLFSVVRGLLPWLPAHRALIENVLAHAISQQVNIQRLDIGWSRAQPVLQLQHVTITDLQTHKVVLVLPEVDLQLDLIQSLWHKQIQFNHVIIKNAELSLYQDPQQKWHLAGSEALFDFIDQDHSNTSKAFIVWLLTIEHLQFSQFHIQVRALHAPAFAVQPLSIDFNNQPKQHQLFAEAMLQGPTKAPIRLALLMKGPAAQLATLDIQAYVSLQGLDLKPWLSQQAWQHWQWQQGTLFAQLWGHWQKNTWQSVQTQLQAKQVRLAEIAVKHGKSLSAKNIDIRGTWQAPTRWQWQIVSHAGQVDFGTLFRNPLAYEQIQAQGEYQSQTPARLHIPYFSVTNPDIQLQAALDLNWLTPDAPVMNLRAGANLLNLNHTSWYLPTGIMPAGVVKWLDDSIKSGDGGQVQMVLRGPIHQFPFKDHSGLMDIRGQLKGIHLNYWPGWPDMSDLNINAQFTEQGMRIDSDHGSSAGLPLQHIEAIIPHYAAPATLQIKASTQNDLSKGIAFIRQSPLKKTLATVAKSDSQGPFAFNLNLNIPLSDDGHTHWQGQLRLQNDQVSWPDYPVQLTQLQGQLSLSDSEVHSQALKASLWDEPLSIDMLKSVTGPLRITGKSQVSISHLPSQWRYSFIQGRAPYRATLTIADQDSQQASEFQVESTLQGFQISLPLGFHKATAEQTPLLIHGWLNDLGQLSQAHADWQLPDQAIQADYQREPAGQRWQLDAPAIQAKLTRPSDATKPWQIYINHLIWQAAPTTSADSTPSSVDPSHLPPMDIRADHVVFGQQTGSLTQLQFRPSKQGALITNIQWQNDLYQLNAHGQWTTQKSQFTGSLNTSKIQALLQSFSLPGFITADTSQFQFNVRWPGAPWQTDLAKTEGHFTAKLNHGSLPSVGADHATTLGLGKVLNLLSLNSLEQHLTLHFQDITDQGFSFNQLDGTFDLNHGTLHIPKLTIASTLADIKTHGCLSLEQHNYQLALQIAPHLTSSLPVLAALAGGPIIGAVGLIANAIASPTISQMTTSYYALTGPWAEPNNVKYSSAKATDAVLKC